MIVVYLIVETSGQSCPWSFELYGRNSRAGFKLVVFDVFVWGSHQIKVCRIGGALKLNVVPVHR